LIATIIVLPLPLRKVEEDDGRRHFFCRKCYTAILANKSDSFILKSINSPRIKSVNNKTEI
jgi:hypothetical protein